MENKHIRELLKRYLLGRANDTDNTIVDNWYRSFDDKPLTLTEEEAAATGSEIWQKITPALEQPKVRRMPPWTRVAAAAIFIAGAAGAYLLLHQTHAPEYATITTGIGEKKNVTMEDGSKLTLDAGTTLRIQKGTRNIELTDGQVFFDVKKDDQHPFTIHTQDLTTTVLGTSFTISAYQGLHDLNIGVVTGKIKVQSATNTLAILSKDEELSYNKTTKAYKTIPLDESMTAWQEGRLLLNDLPFPEMAVLMHKNFGITIETTQDAVAHTKYTTELQRSMTADEAVRVLAAIHHLKIKKQNNKFLLYK